MIEKLVQRLINREGGYVDHPLDRGGPTNMGITLGTLRIWRDEEVTPDDVRNLTHDEAHRIYYNMYWKAPGLSSLTSSAELNEMLFDAAVHHGPTKAIKLLQTALGVTDDGLIGPKTQRAATTFPPSETAAYFMAGRVAYLGRIITQSPGQAVFAAGWFRRMQEFIEVIPRI